MKEEDSGNGDVHVTWIVAFGAMYLLFSRELAHYLAHQNSIAIFRQNASELLAEIRVG